MGIIVPPGRHQIVFQFDPFSFKCGVRVRAAGLTILVCFGTVVSGHRPRSAYEKLMRLFRPVFDPAEHGVVAQIGVPSQSH